MGAGGSLLHNSNAIHKCARRRDVVTEIKHTAPIARLIEIDAVAAACSQMISLVVSVNVLATAQQRGQRRQRTFVSSSSVELVTVVMRLRSAAASGIWFRFR